MAKLGRYVLLCLSALVFFFTVGLITLIFFVDPNQFKNIITSRATKALGHEVVINGDVRWSFIPWLSIEVNKVEIKNPNEFKGIFATLDKVLLSVNLLPLLHHELVINKILLQQPHINLIRKANGQTNWEMIHTHQNEGLKNKKNRSAPNKSNSSPLLPLVYTASNFNISHGNLIYQDAVNNEKLIIQDANFKSQNLSLLNKLLDGSATKNNSKLLQELNLSGNADINKVQFNDILVNHLHFHINAKQGKINISSISANIFDGYFRGNLSIDASSNIPHYMLTENFQNIEAGQLFNRWLKGKSFSISGLLNLKGSLQASGNDSETLIKTLQGHLKFSIGKGIFYGIDIVHQLKTAQSIFLKKAVVAPSNSDLNQTIFNSLSGEVNIDHSVLTTNNLQLLAPTLVVNGNGYVNLLNQVLDYKLKVIAQVSPDFDPRILQAQKVLGGAIPIKITGTLQNYQVYPDTPPILLASAKYYLQKSGTTLENVSETQLKELGNRLKSELSKIFN